MPYFVTDIRPVDSARRAEPSRAAAEGHANGVSAYRRRLAALRVLAPDTLRARLRRDLGLAVATSRTE